MKRCYSVHFARESGAPACDPMVQKFDLGVEMTTSKKRVTCGLCRRTAYFKKAKS